MRGSTINITQQLVTEDCCVCGVAFAFPTELRQKCLDDHSRQFYCPNGHSQGYVGKTDAEKERERADRERERAERLASQVRHVGQRLEAERRSHSATKGTLTKVKKRTANGVCPCCNRTFANVGRHMAGQHPDYVAAAV